MAETVETERKISDLKKSYEKSYAYYKNVMYEKSKGASWIHSSAKEIYNPIPSLINTVGVLVRKGLTITKDESLDEEYERLDEINDYRNFVKSLVKKACLYEEIFIEKVGDYLNIIEKQMVTELIKEHGHIKYALIGGENEAGESVSKEIYNGFFIIDGQEVEKHVVIETTEGKEPVEIPFLAEYMPLQHINVGYKLYQAFNKIDRINEYEQFLYAMSKANGDPKLLLKLIDKLTKEEKEELGVEKHFNETERVIWTSEENAVVQYIELSGKIMPYLEKRISVLKDDLKDDFPELNLIEAVSGSNIALDTTVIKLTEIEDKVQDIREEVKKALEKALKNQFQTKLIVNFGDIIPKDVDKIIERYRGLLTDGVISKQTYMEKIKELGIIRDVAKELKQIQKEEQAENYGEDDE